MTNKYKFKVGAEEVGIEPLKRGRFETLTTQPGSVSAPGAGEIFIGDVHHIITTPDKEGFSRFKVEVKGRNIAQIYTEVWMRQGNRLAGPLRTEFLKAPKEREVRGIKHPRWSEQNEIEFTASATIRHLECGESHAIVSVKAEKYSAEPSAQIWGVEGVYQRGGGEPFRVTLVFDNSGKLIRKTGFYPASGREVVAPFDLILEEGDTFEPLMMVINEKKEISWGTLNPIMVRQGCPFTLTESANPTSETVLDILVEDFDGQYFRRQR